MSDSNITQAPFKFRNFFVAESSIKLEPSTKADNIDVNIQPQGIIFEEQKEFQVKLDINLTSEDGLKVKVLLIGLFKFKDVINQDHLGNYFYVNAPAILFPYLRSYISALTALSGCNTIIIPPMNMTTLGEQLKKHTETV